MVCSNILFLWKIFKLYLKTKKYSSWKIFRVSDKFKNQKLSEKWFELIKIRNICNISIEEKR